MIKKIGIERRVHTAGKNKSTLDPFLEEKQEDIERLKNIQLDLHKDFIEIVEESRGSKLNKKDTAVTLKKLKIKNNTEKMGFFVQTTNIEDVKQKAENNKKRLDFKNIYKSIMIELFF